MSGFLSIFSDHIAVAIASVATTAIGWITKNILGFISVKIKNSKVLGAMKLLEEVTRDSVLASEQMIANGLREDLKDNKITKDEFKIRMQALGREVLKSIVEKVFDKLKGALGLPDDQIHEIIRNKMESIIPEAKVVVSQSRSVQVPVVFPHEYYRPGRPIL